MEIDQSQQITATTERQINWTDTPIFEFYLSGQDLSPDAKIYSEKELDDLLDEMKNNYEQYRNNVDAHYNKALSTLDFLLSQQESNKFEKIKQLYKQVNLENTLKLLIRCKLTFEGRKKIIQMFRSVHFYEQQYENLKYILEKKGKIVGEYIEFDKENIDQINKRSKETRKFAENVLKRAQEVRKSEAGKDQDYCVIYNNQDLIERILEEMKMMKGWLERCKKSVAMESSPEAPEKDEEEQVESQRQQSEMKKTGSYSQRQNMPTVVSERRNTFQSRKASMKPLDRKPSIPKPLLDRKASIPKPPSHSIHKSSHSIQKSSQSRSPLKQNIYTPDMLPVIHQAPPQMSRTSAGFNKLNFKQLEQKRIRSLSKKRQQKKQQRQIMQAQVAYMSMTPLPDASKEYSTRDHTFANDMKRALNRKLNPIPRRQDIIYDLNGRPIYMGNTADQSSPRIKSKFSNQGEMMTYHAASNMHPLMEQDVSNQTLLNQISNKKNIKQMNLRTNYTVQPLYGKRKQSVQPVQMPKLNHFNVIKNQSPKITEPTSQRLDNKTQASLKQCENTVDLSMKTERPIAASEKSHIFNPRAASNKPTEDFSVDASGEHDTTERIQLNVSSQPDIKEEQEQLKKVQLKIPTKKAPISRKLSPIMQSGSGSCRGPILNKKSTLASAIKKDDLAQDSLMEDSMMEFSQISQRQHIWKSRSPGGRASISPSQAGAVGTLYFGNTKNDQFTSTYSNTWQNTSQLMFHDSHLGSATKRQDREAKALQFQWERKMKKEKKKDDDAAKQALVDHYYNQYGVLPSKQQIFFMDPVRLRELLTKKAVEATQDKAARKIQNWWTCKMNRRAFIRRLKNTIRVTIMIQRKWRRFYRWYLLPRRHMALKRKNTGFIQVFLRGYLARRATLKAKAAYQAEKLYQEYHRIDVIMKANLQRRIRRVWLQYKERKAEKKRKKAEAAEAAKKGKKKKRTTVAATPVAPTPTVSSTKVTKGEKQEGGATIEKFGETGLNIMIGKQHSVIDTDLIQKSQTMNLDRKESQMFDDENAEPGDDDENGIFDEVQNKTVVMSPIVEELEANNNDIEHEVKDQDEDMERDLEQPEADE